jgi:hypothetical protein
VHEFSVDTGSYYYYAPSSGELVAVRAYGVVQGNVCAAGPASGFTEPQCPAGALQPACPPPAP